jgi:hypothetical protein
MERNGINFDELFGYLLSEVPFEAISKAVQAYLDTTTV